MSREQISIIIPVYNAGKYLEACVTSVLRSTYEPLEVILVDDCSTDDSGPLCDQLAEKDERIKVIHCQENGGQGKARNAGLTIMSGDYVGFVDADDTIHPEMYEKLYNLLKTHHADISFCSRKVISDWLPDEHEDTGVSVFEDGKIDVSRLGHGDDLESPVLKLYKKEIFSHLRFPESHWAEDLFIVPDYLAQASRIAYTSEQLYFYSVRKDNASFKKPTRERLDFQILGYEKLYRFFKLKAFDSYRFARYVLFSYAQAWLSFNDVRTRFHYWKGYVRFFAKNVGQASSKGSLLFLLAPGIYCSLMRHRQKK